MDTAVKKRLARDSKLPSIRGLATFDTDRSAVRYMRDNYWDVDDVKKAVFQGFYILRFSKPHFLEVLKDGTITAKGVKYNVVYHNCDTAQLRRKSTKSVLLSFRFVDPMYELAPVVLVASSTKPI